MLGSIGNALRLNAAANRLEVRFAELERIVMDVETVDHVLEIERERPIDFHGREVPDSAFIERQPDILEKNFADDTLSCAGTIVWLSSMVMVFPLGIAPELFKL
jgi:hypothetical protein